MNNWELIKERAAILYRQASQVLVFLFFWLYLLSCVVAARPVGPRGYVSFVYHCFKWRGPVRNAVRRVSAEER
jgi:hypothetical protein